MSDFVSVFALVLGYCILYGCVTILAASIWAFALVAVLGVIRGSFLSIRLYYRMLLWSKAKEKVEAFLCTEEGRVIYARIVAECESYQREETANDKAIDLILDGLEWLKA